MLRSAPPDIVPPVIVFIVVDLGLGIMPGRRMRLDVGQRFLLFQQVVAPCTGAGDGRGAAVGNDGGGPGRRVEVARVADWRQIIFGIDQPRRGGASRGRLRGFAGPLPMCVIRLTGHGCQGKGIRSRIGDLSGAFAWQSVVCPPNPRGSAPNRPAKPIPAAPHGRSPVRPKRPGGGWQSGRIEYPAADKRDVCGGAAGTVRSLTVMRLGRSRRSARRGFAALCALVLVTSGCARFNDAQSQPFTTAPELKPQPSSTPPPPPPLPPTPFPKACPAPGVMQGCLESTSGLIM